jgi:hypothetical protein
MKKVNQMMGKVLLASMLGQNLAFAYDSAALSRLSPEAQRLRSDVRERIENLSEDAQLKLSYRLYRVAFKALPKIEKMSSTESVDLSTDVEVIAKDELEPVLQDMHDRSIPSLPASSPVKVPHADFVQSVRSTLEKFGANDDSEGNSKPLNAKQFNEKILQLGSKNSKSQNRMPADFKSTIGTVLEILLFIVLGCAAIGVVVLLGWMGLAIVMGALVVTLVIYLSVLAGAFGDGVMGNR